MLDLLKDYIRRHKEELTIVCPLAEQDLVLDALFGAGYHVKASGPYVDAGAVLDVERRTMIAERDIAQ